MAEKKQLKPILIGAAIAIVAVGLTVGGTFFFLSQQQSNELAVVSDADLNEGSTAPAPAHYFEFEKPFITSVAQAGRARYMQVYVALLYRDQAAKADLEIHRPLLRSRLLTLFGSGDFMALQSEEGRRVLKTDALAAVNDVLESEAAPPIDQVLFTNFVLQ